MNRIIKYLKEERLTDLSKLHAVEVFGREGDWFTKKLADNVKKIDIWEINKDYIKNLKKNIPSAHTENVNSIDFISICNKKFDIVSIDNPQGIFGEKYTEHFDVLIRVNKILNNNCFVIFNINFFPYDKREYNKIGKDDYGMNDVDRWFKNREYFYNSDKKSFSIEFMENFYKKLFDSFNYKIVDFKSFIEPSNIDNHPDFTCRCVVELQKK